MQINPSNRKQAIKTIAMVPLVIALVITRFAVSMADFCLREKNSTSCKGTPWTFEAAPTTTEMAGSAANWVVPVTMTSRCTPGQFHASYGDVDNDGDVDMIALMCRGNGPGYENEGQEYHTYARLAYFENTSPTGVRPHIPKWEEQTTWSLSAIASPSWNEYHFLCSAMKTFTHLVDFDMDGDLDLLVVGVTTQNLGNADNSYSRSWYENVGTVSIPNWETTSNAQWISVTPNNQYYSMWFCDIDR